MPSVGHGSPETLFLPDYLFAFGDSCPFTSFKFKHSIIPAQLYDDSSSERFHLALSQNHTREDHRRPSGCAYWNAFVYVENGLIMPDHLELYFCHIICVRIWYPIRRVCVSNTMTGRKVDNRVYMNHPDFCFIVGHECFRHIKGNENKCH